MLVLSQFGITTLKLEHGLLVIQVLEANVLQLDLWLEVEEIPAFLQDLPPSLPFLHYWLCGSLFYLCLAGFSFVFWHVFHLFGCFLGKSVCCLVAVSCCPGLQCIFPSMPARQNSFITCWISAFILEHD